VSGIACRLEEPAGRVELAMPTRDHVYRIACEAVLNAARHAKATAIVIEVQRNAAGVAIAVRDDGAGIAPGTTEGMGLRLMESRAKMIGATLAIAGRPGGTTVTCTVPISGEAA
jgi:signal transduction histidine kinase